MQKIKDMYNDTFFTALEALSYGKHGFADEVVEIADWTRGLANKN